MQCFLRYILKKGPFYSVLFKVYFRSSFYSLLFEVYFVKRSILFSVFEVYFGKRSISCSPF